MHPASLLGKDKRRPPVNTLWIWQEPSVASAPNEVCKNLAHIGMGRPALALVNVVDVRRLVIELVRYCPTCVDPGISVEFRSDPKTSRSPGRTVGTYPLP